MAQLSDDCFAFGGELMRMAEALAILAERVEVTAGVETMPLPRALNRFLAQDVVSTRAVPPNDNAAVDGYAVFFDDLNAEEETRLRVVGRVAAGGVLEQAPRRGEAVRIFTGAPMPAGPDTVFMQEDCRAEGDIVSLPPGQKRGANRRRAGEDIAAGATILRRGTRLRPQEIGLAASVGVTSLSVYRPLQVAIFSTGDELREPGDAAEAGAIYDANRYMLAGLLTRLGFGIVDLGILPDRREAIVDALATAADTCDAVISSGGMSTGEEDHVRAAVEALGSIHFWRLAIRPGRPVALGQVRGKPFLGLPGNPVAMMVSFLRFARPVLLRLSGAADTEPVLYPIVADFETRKKVGRREWLRVRVVRDAERGLVAHKFPRDGAGILTSLVEADGLVELAEEVGHVQSGDTVWFLPFAEVDV